MTIPIDAVDPGAVAAQQWRQWEERYTWHLDLVPGLLDAMQLDVVPLAATRYDAVRVDMSRDGAPVPFRVEIVDAIDDLWAALIQYAENVDEELQRHAPLVLAPVPRVRRWRVRGEVAGLRAGGDPRTDAFAIVAWLIDRVQWIAPLERLGDSEDYLFTMIRRLRGRHLGAPIRRRRRVCSLCLTGEVAIVYVDEPLSTKGKRVARCNLCGQEHGDAHA